MKAINIDTITKKVAKANEIALVNTEKTILKSIDVAENWQQKTENGIHNLLSFSEKQQDSFFTFLEKTKARFQKKETNK